MLVKISLGQIIALTDDCCLVCVLLLPALAVATAVRHSPSDLLSTTANMKKEMLSGKH